MAYDKGPGCSMTQERAIIVAVADDGAIGKKNTIPWHIREDMRFFRRTTTGNTVIMGWKTFLSLGCRPLPSRTNIVISTHGMPDPVEGVIFADSLADAFGKASPEGKVFVMGGAKTYVGAMDMVDTLYVTEVHTTVPDADTFFPKVDLSMWQETGSSELRTDPENGLAYRFVVYKRKKQ